MEVILLLKINIRIMVTTNLTGNLGNHMWQYSVCRVVAEKLGYEWGVNPSPTHDYHRGMNQMYFMDVDFGIFPEGDFNDFHEKWLTYKHVDDVNITMLDKRVYEIPDWTRLIGDNGAFGGIYQSEDYLIDRKKDIVEWFKIKDVYKNEYDKKLIDLGITLDENTCVINFRGGEYKSIPNVILRIEYWKNSVEHIKNINPNMNFIVITDDPNTANRYIPYGFKTFHVDIGFDFYVVNNAKNLIISNSTFGWWAAWLNTKCNITIAPKYWARHNVSDGYWATGDSYTRGFTYMDREGKLSLYDECKTEAIKYYKQKGIL